MKVSSRDADWKLFDNTTWQVRRSEFDKMMLDEAIKRGAKILRGTAIKALQGEDGALVGIRMRHPNGEEEDVSTKVVLDCSGQSTFLANQKVTGPKYMGSYDKQVAFFTHVRGAIRGSGTSGEEAKDNTLILYDKKFHWAWFIPIDKEVVSLGNGDAAGQVYGEETDPRGIFPERGIQDQSRDRAPRAGARHGREGARDS